LRPIGDGISVLVVGGALTIMLALHGVTQYLFGVWMCMFGLTNLASPLRFPGIFLRKGFFYVIWRRSWLLLPQASFY
jgi:hypothetical protein